MKYLFLFIVLNFLTSTLSFSQNDTICGILPQKNGLVFYTEVVEKKGASANQLYSTAKIWISESFKESRPVTQADVENSTLSIKGLLNDHDKSKIGFNLNIQFKDGKYKYEITNIRIIIPQFDMDVTIESRPAISSCFQETLRNYDEIIKDLIEDLKIKLNSTDDNW